MKRPSKKQILLKYGTPLLQGLASRDQSQSIRPSWQGFTKWVNTLITHLT